MTVAAQISSLLAVAVLSGGCADTPSTERTHQGDAVMTHPPAAAAPSDPTGVWVLRGASGGECRLTLSADTAEPRAGGTPPPPMQGARAEGDCGLGAIGGWRRAAGGAIELVDPYGQTVTTLDPQGAGFARAGVSLSRP